MAGSIFLDYKSREEFADDDCEICEQLTREVLDACSACVDNCCFNPDGTIIHRKSCSERFYGNSDDRKAHEKKAKHIFVRKFA